MGSTGLCSFFLNQCKYLVNLIFLKKYKHYSGRAMKSHTYPPLLSGCPVLCPVQDIPVSLSLAQGRGELGHLPHGCHSAGRLSEHYHLLYLLLGNIGPQSNVHTQNCFQFAEALGWSGLLRNVGKALGSVFHSGSRHFTSACLSTH